ncbi:reverse transcriptase domain-containing protein [Tanacetum coccineum]
MDMINDQDIEHMISPTPPPDYPLMSYLSGRDVDRMAPKRTSTSAAPAMSQAAIRKLVADSVDAALEAQAATMANTDNTNRNTGPRETPVAIKCSYKEFMSCQPLNFKGTDFKITNFCAVASSMGFKQTESVFLRSNCTEDYKVKFAIGTLTEEALSWWNSFAQPIGIEEAYKISWSEFKKLLIKKYCPRTEVKKIEDEFYNLTVKGNDLKTYIRRFKNSQFYVQLWKLLPFTPEREMLKLTKHNSVQGTNDHKREFYDGRTFTTNNNNYQYNRNNNSNRNNDHQQQQNRRQETVRAYAVTLTELQVLYGSLLLSRGKESNRFPYSGERMEQPKRENGLWESNTTRAARRSSRICTLMANSSVPKASLAYALTLVGWARESL